ncbi:MAG: metallophosphoesterase [Pigmentiphaga sp.]|nr:metallophosphoesterase [Pigmentiphaga sp.]
MASLPSFRFAVLADTHANPEDEGALSPFASHRLTNSRLRHAVRQLNRLNPDFVVHVGDMVHPVPDAALYPEAVAAFREAMAELQAPLHVVAGNHDSGDKHAAYVPAGVIQPAHLAQYEAHFGRPYYAFEHGGCHGFVLHTSLINSGLPEEAAQARWFEQAAAQAAGRKFLFLHYPPFVASADEPGHYDNLDEPGRGWLLERIARHGFDAVFTGHVHNFFCNEIAGTPVFLMPSTGFARADYAEVLSAPQPQAHENGRNDVAKLAILVVDVYPDRIVPQLLRLYPEPGLDAEPSLDSAPAARFSAQRDWPRLPPAYGWLPTLGLDLRHDWTALKAIPFSSMLDEFQRKQARNDYAIMALWEMGIRHLRVPLQDLRDPAARQRMRLLASQGNRFRVFAFQFPEPAACALLAEHRDWLTGLELVLPWPPADTWPDRLRATQLATGLPLSVSRFWNAAHEARTGKQVKLLVDHGFTPDDPELEAFAPLAGQAPLAALVFRIAQDQPVAEGIDRAIHRARALGLAAQVHVRLADDSPARARRDEAHNVRRVVEAALAAFTHPEHAVFLDTLNDVDRGYFPRRGLVDNLYNPRLSGTVLRTLHGLLTEGVPIGAVEWQSLAEGRLAIVALADGELRVFLPNSPDQDWELALPASRLGEHLSPWNLATGQPGDGVAVDAEARRWRGRSGSPAAISLR